LNRVGATHNYIKMKNSFNSDLFKSFEKNEIKPNVSLSASGGAYTVRNDNKRDTLFTGTYTLSDCHNCDVSEAVPGGTVGGQN